MNKSISSDLINQVEKAIDISLPQRREAELLLGVSGGPDSMSLLYILSRLEMRVTAVHCNYRLRGKDSDLDQRLVEQSASMWGFEAVSLRLDPNDAAGENLQAWARRRRYQVFRDLKREIGADAVVTAHHQDDQLETIIQKILRGAGLTAWQGMKPWDGELFRPLLAVSKAHLLQFASANHVPYRLDGSNEESTYARNFLRNGWFPVMDDLFPGWRENLLRIPERAREHEALTQSLIRALQEEEGVIRRERLLALPLDVQRTILLQVLKSIDRSAGVSTGALETADSLTGLQTGRRLPLTGTWSVLRDRELFRLVREGEEPAIPAPRKLSREELRNELSIHSLRLSVTDWNGKLDPSCLQLDADKITWPLQIRRWKAGDRINPFGMEGTQSIADHLTNEKIPSVRKGEVLVIESFDEIICAIIFPELSATGRPGTISNRARCGDQTRTILEIRQKG